MRVVCAHLVPIRSGSPSPLKRAREHVTQLLQEHDNLLDAIQDQEEASQVTSAVWYSIQSADVCRRRRSSMKQLRIPSPVVARQNRLKGPSRGKSSKF